VLPGESWDFEAFLELGQQILGGLQVGLVALFEYPDAPVERHGVARE
jgi:hypothetical protein